MTQSTAQSSFEAPPSENAIHNVIASQPKALYLNKPKHHPEEEDANGTSDPLDTQEPSTSSSSEPNHDWQKRYSDLKSYHDRQIALAKAKEQEQARILAEKERALEVATKQEVKLPSTPTEVQSFIKNYPDLANIIKTFVLEENLTTKAELEKAIKENEKKMQAIAAEKARLALLELHPDADTIKDDPDFITWYEEQIPLVKQLLTSDFVADVARGLDIYKKDKGIIRQTKAEKEKAAKAAAMSVSTNSVVEVGTGKGKIWTASEVKRIPTSQYHKYEAEIMKALSEGRYNENA